MKLGKPVFTPQPLGFESLQNPQHVTVRLSEPLFTTVEKKPYTKFLATAAKNRILMELASMKKCHFEDYGFNVKHLLQQSETDLKSLGSICGANSGFEGETYSQLINNDQVFGPLAKVDGEDLVEVVPFEWGPYFGHNCRLNDVLGISTQLQNDIDNVVHHKYVAHQITVLYRFLSNVHFGKNYKKIIESKFEEIKASLKPSVGVPILSVEYRHFLMDLTTEVIACCHTTSVEMMAKLGSASKILQAAGEQVDFVAMEDIVLAPYYENEVELSSPHFKEKRPSHLRLEAIRNNSKSKSPKKEKAAQSPNLTNTPTKSRHSSPKKTSSPSFNTGQIRPARSANTSGHLTYVSDI